MIISTDFEYSTDNFRLNSRCEIKNRITGVFGISGSGKTTFLNLLAGLQKPVSGKIIINDKTLVDTSVNINIPLHKRRIGYVFQDTRLFPHMNVLKNLTYAHKNPSLNQKILKETIDLLELGPYLKSMPGNISGGQAQRVAIGRALLSNAKILLLDEPFTALDKPLKKQVITFLNRIIEHLDIPIIVVSHELNDLLLLTQEIIIIQDGKTFQPKSYIDLIREKKLLELNGHGLNYHNIYSGEIIKTDKNNGISGVQIQNSPDVQLIVESDNIHLPVKSHVKISLRGADVSVALREITDISIKNQLGGTIETLYQHRNHLVCIVDCGIKVITRVTLDSGKKLGLKTGKKVWCLFKSLAIETFN
ncbi:MAG: molybdenum ABC transporter ATP-binding protein [Bacteroidales bacterium]|nr:molybdenum ABC transporter ATP-binding protein [Bacteroidales bacterium]